MLPSPSSVHDSFLAASFDQSANHMLATTENASANIMKMIVMIVNAIPIALMYDVKVVSFTYKKNKIAICKNFENTEPLLRPARML